METAALRPGTSSSGMISGCQLCRPRSQKFRLLQLLPSLAHVAVVTASWMLAQVTIATNFSV